MNYLKLIGLAALTLVSMTATAETVAPTTGDGIVQLSELSGHENITCFAGEHVRLNKSTNNNPLTIEGTVYESGIGTHAPSVCVVKLNGATTFHAIIGVDDEADQQDNHGIIDFTISGYGATISDVTTIASGHLDRQTDSYHYVLDIADLSGYQYLKLDFATGTKPWADHVDIADARFTYAGELPVIVAAADMYVDESKIVNLPTAPDIEGARIIPLSSLQITNITNGWGTVKADKSIDGNPLTMKGIKYTSGVGMHAAGKVVIKLNSTTPAFHALIGIDDEVAGNCKGNAKSNVKYEVILRDLAGRETIAQSGIINYNDAEPVRIDYTNLTEYKYLILNFDPDGANESDHVDIANAYFEFVFQNSNEPEIIAESALGATLDCATTVFSQPGVRFMQKLHSVNSDAVITVEGLPAGLTYNAERQLIEGKIETEGTYTYSASVSFDDEKITKDITLTVSSNLQMPTPFMGWMSWNVVQGDISHEVVTQVVDNMEKYGLIKAGYNYLMIDDLWHASARESGTDKPLANATRFPGQTLKPTGDYVHSKGMLFGNYSDVAPKTCAGAFGSLDYEAIDAATYAEWGIDMVKVDYCGAPADQPTCAARYEKFGKELNKYGTRLFVCEWGVREPWKWAAEVGSPVWRCTQDARDCWEGRGSGEGIVQSIRDMKDLWMYNGVNRWNDADMVCIGIHGTGRSSSDLCATGPGMTMDEYGTQMALWCMWSSPIAVTADLRKNLGTGERDLTQADIDLLTNADLLALNQDPMGQSGMPLLHNEDFFVMAKDLENGDIALSVTNLSASPKSYTFNLGEIPGLDGTTSYIVRDAMKQKNCDNATATLEVSNIPSHATAVYRLSTSAQDGINTTEVAEALSNMTVSVDGNTLHVCLPGTLGSTKRIIVSDLAGRVVAEADGTDECFTLAAPARGIYVVNTTCVARSQSAKVTI